MANFKIRKSVDWQFQEFLSGFRDVIPLELISSFDENELQSLICGVSEINVREWKDNVRGLAMEKSNTADHLDDLPLLFTV